MAGLATNVSGSMKMSNIANIIGVMFMSRTYSHMAHLKTSSYSKHKALNKFYDNVVDLADDLAEAAQGTVGKLDIPFIGMEGEVLDPITALTGHLSRIEGYASTCKEEYLKNIFQEIQALYRKTLYLMKELD